MKKLQKSIRTIAVAMLMGTAFSLTSCDVMLAVAGGMADAMLTGMSAGGTSTFGPTYSTGMMGTSTSSDPQYQAYLNYKKSGLPGASTISYEDFKKANARAAANGYQIGKESNKTSSNSNNNSSTTKRHKCGFCGGSGREVKTDAVSFGYSKYCNECGKTVSGSHYHTTCSSCKGKGWW